MRAKMLKREREREREREKERSLTNTYDLALFLALTLMGKPLWGKKRFPHILSWMHDRKRGFQID